MEPSDFPPAPALLAPLAPWFEAERRVLPWRAADLAAPHPDPYAVLVSEIMLQQTQVATVIPYFERWMRRLPDLAALAGAGEDEIHGLWAGLGYYRRARNLQAAARVLAERGWPEDLDGLLQLPGFGPYTAAAVAAQAFQWPTPALDGNVFRVSARLLALETDPRPLAPALRAWLAPALAAHGPSRLTQALMELGATLCGAQPRCASCPLQDGCAGHRLGIAAGIPPAQPRAKVTEVQLHLLALSSPKGWLLRRPGGKGLLAGLWSWPWTPVLEPGPSLAARAAPSLAVEAAPSLAAEAVPSQAAETAVAYAAAQGRAFPGWVQVYSHRRETVHPLRLDLASSPEAPAGTCWVPEDELAGLAMGRRDQRLRDLLAGPGRPLLPAEFAAVAALLRS